MSVGIRFEGITASLGGRPVLRDVSFTVPPGVRTALVGPNGGGKTTLVRVLVGALAAESGRVVFVDESGREVPRPRVGYLSQRSTLSAQAPVSGVDLVALSLDPRPGFGRRDEARREARAALLRAGLPGETLDRPVGKLSGGQRQRVLLARALAGGPAMLVLDEPDTALDAKGLMTLRRVIAEESGGRADHPLRLARHGFDGGRGRPLPGGRRRHGGAREGGAVIEFLAYPFFQRALVAGVVAAVLCGTLSFFVVLRRLAFAGSGVAHAAFGGVAVATLAGPAARPRGARRRADRGRGDGPRLRGLGRLGGRRHRRGHRRRHGRRRRGPRLREDERRPLRPDVREHPDGQPRSTSRSSSAPRSPSSRSSRRGSVRCSSPRWTRTARARPASTSARCAFFVLVLIAVTVVVALKVVGILLVAALLVLPGATARTLFDRWPGLLLGSVAAALVMVLGGLLLSVALNVASGAAIILLGTVLFVAAFLLSRRETDN